MAAMAGHQCASAAGEAELGRWVGRSARSQFVITNQLSHIVATGKPRSGVTPQ